MGLRKMIIKWLAKADLEEIAAEMANQPKRGRGTALNTLSSAKCYPVEDCGSGSTNPSPEMDSILNFRVYNAVGSYVVEFHRYDTRNDRRNNSLYTISHDADFGEAIAKISAAEIIKQ